MNKQFYFLSPVEVVKVTQQNIAEVAEWCGGKVLETPSRRVEGKMDKYVWVPTPKSNGMSWAFPGMYITRRIVMAADNKVKETWAVYHRDYFEKNYFETPDEAVSQTWEKKGLKKGETKIAKPEPTTIIVNVMNGDNLTEAAEKVKAALQAQGIDNEVLAGMPES